MEQPTSKIDYLIIYLETLSKIKSGEENVYPMWVNEKLQQTCVQIESIIKDMY